MKTIQDRTIKGRTIKGTLSAQNKKVAVAVATFNSTITEQLCNGAIEAWERHQGDSKNIDIIWVPGAFELPAVTKKLETLGIYDAIVCLGAVIRGETSHYDFVAGNTASGISQIGQQGNIPVLFGVLTVDTLEQALNRAGLKSGNIGYDAMVSAIDMMSVYEQIATLK